MALSWHDGKTTEGGSRKSLRAKFGPVRCVIRYRIV
jgi:hypothetical protein